MRSSGHSGAAQRAAALLIALSLAVGCDNRTETDGSMPTPDGGHDAGGGGDDGGVDAGMDAGAMDAGGDDAGGDDAGGGDAGGDASTTDGGTCTPTPERTWLECTDGVDNDCDGDTDTDVGCSVCIPAGAPEHVDEADATTCADGLDNDCDGFADCDDFGCDGFAACGDESTDALCMDGIDNDGDDRFDCLDSGCAATTPCRPAVAEPSEATDVLCGNHLDDDHDGDVDCDDSECAGIGFCGTEDNDGACADGEDNDGDGVVDCLDFQCASVAACMGEDSDVACADGLDNDGDGDVDCRDSDCFRRGVCVDHETACDDAGDEDLDGFTDCTDFDCATDAACTAGTCSATNWFGTCAMAMEVCSGGVCARPLSSFTDLSTSPPLLITEIMPNPAVLSDNDAEYTEVTNVSGGPIDLSGLTWSEAGGASTTITGPMVLMAGESVLFLLNDDSTENGGLTGVDVSGSLNNGTETVTIAYMGTTIHAVTYPGTGNDRDNVGTGGGASSVNGRSMNLDQAFIDGTTTTARWCATAADAANQYEASGPNYGTPGAANIVCP